MKIKSILTALLLLLMAGVQTMWAQNGQILSMTLTLRYNGSQAITLPVISEGWPVLDMTEEITSSIIIQKVDVQTTGTVSGVTFFATMYKTENGLQPDDGWRTFQLNDLGNGQWQLDLGPGAELIDSEMTSPRTFQFYLKAQDGSGNAIFFNNGGEDYKLLFVPGKSDQPETSKIKSLKLTISHNGGEPFVQSFPQTGWQELVIEGRTTSLKILRAEVEVEAPLQYVDFYATMYNAEDGGPYEDDDWTTTPFVYQGDNIWALEAEGGFELVESEWLVKDRTKTFEFFVYAEDEDGFMSYYDNGGPNYRVTFSTANGGGGGGDDKGKVSFMELSTATISLKVNNDETRGYIFDGDGARYPDDMPLGDLYSLKIDGYYLSCIFTSETGYDATMQYKVYEAGGDGQWNGIQPDDIVIEQGFDHETQKDYLQLFCFADGLNIDVSSGLEYGKDYVLEIMYQVIAYDNYFFFGRDLETTRFPFHYDNETGIRTMDDGRCAMDDGAGAYNLAGQRVGDGYKGIVITGGRKALRK